MAGSVEELQQHALGIILRAAAPGTDLPPIQDDNGLLRQCLDKRIILPAGPFNHVTVIQANKCCDEAFRDGDRAPKVMKPVVGVVRDWLCSVQASQASRCDTRD
jgi:hypothetical protein